MLEVKRMLFKNGIGNVNFNLIGRQLIYHLMLSFLKSHYMYTMVLKCSK